MLLSESRIIFTVPTSFSEFIQNTEVQSALNVVEWQLGTKGTILGNFLRMYLKNLNSKGDVVFLDSYMLGFAYIIENNNVDLERMIQVLDRVDTHVENGGMIMCIVPDSVVSNNESIAFIEDNSFISDKQIIVRGVTDFNNHALERDKIHS